MPNRQLQSISNWISEDSKYLWRHPLKASHPPSISRQVWEWSTFLYLLWRRITRRKMVVYWQKKTFFIFQMAKSTAYYALCECAFRHFVVKDINKIKIWNLWIKTKQINLICKWETSKSESEVLESEKSIFCWQRFCFWGARVNLSQVSLKYLFLLLYQTKDFNFILIWKL